MVQVAAAAKEAVQRTDRRLQERGPRARLEDSSAARCEGTGLHNHACVIDMRLHYPKAP